MNYELDCKWHFAKREADGDNGPNSAMSQNFVQFPCFSLIRESVQNSLDAILDTTKPVVVCFEYRSFEKEDYKNFFQIAEHIEAGRRYYQENPTAKAVYPKMLQYLEKTNEVGFIRVSDYNTKGMDYETGKTNKTFYAFVRSEGVSVKQQEGAGGSFGFGKGAFFVMSPINTLIVSTRNNEDKCHFQGVTRLCSHVIDGQMYSHMGFYDNNDGQPTEEFDRIPIPFRRDEPGTSIGIMGIERQSWEDSIDGLVKEVLSNFFVAILRGKLIVYINGNKTTDNDVIAINKDSITALMERYFPSTKDVRTKHSFNPRPYFEAITNSDIPPFVRELPILGKVELHIKEFEKNVTQTIFLRKLLMKVFRDSHSLGNYNGVFICDNEKGNKILGDMEDPEHKSWNPEECKKPEKSTEYDVACQANVEIQTFINDCLDKLTNMNSSESRQVAGLEKYLPSIDNEKGKGDKGNPFTGKPTGHYVTDGSSLTTEGQLKEKTPPTKRSKGNVEIITEGGFDKDPNGNETGGTGGGSNNGNNGPNKPGDNYGPGNSNNNHGAYNRIVEVDWRPVQSKKKGCVDIVIYPPHNIPKAKLYFQIGREGKSSKADKEDVSIIRSNKGNPNGLKLENVELKGLVRNIIQIEFSDKLSHTLKLSVYEVN